MVTGDREQELRLELEASRDEFDDLFGSIRSILISVDTNGFVRRWSSASTQTFGLPTESVVGKAFTQLDIDWDWQAVMRAAELCRSANLPTRVEDLEVRTGTSTRQLGITVTPCRRGGFLILGADITFKRLEEKVLLERERFYRSIVDNIQDVIFETDAAGRWTFLNPAYQTFVGGTVSEATGRPALDHVLPQDRHRVLAHIAPLIRGQVPTARFEIRYLREDGEEGWAEVHVEAQRDERGDFIGTFGTIREVSERRRNAELERRLAQQMLRQTEDRVKTIIESAPLIVFTLDKDGVITFCDGRTLSRFGTTSKDIEGRRAVDTMPNHPEGHAAIAEALAGRPSKVHLQFGDLHLDVCYSPVFDASGQPNGATGVAIDVTESRKLEAQLIHARKMESIGHLAAGLAHEVNTPTQYIADNTRFIRDNFHMLRGMLRLAKEAVRGDLQNEFLQVWKQADMDYLLDEIPAALEQSLEGLKRVSQIVKSMKQFSHPGTQDFQWADLNEQIESTLTVTRNEWKFVARVETDFDPGLPKVWCAPAELNQVVLNMIVNASHAIADSIAAGKYDQGCIRITTRSVGESVEIAISDDGNGIDKAIQGKIFDPFFTTKDPGKGTGQGLALAHSVIVDMHRGTLSVDSTLGVGTTFTIQLPKEGASSAPIPMKEAA